MSILLILILLSLLSLLQAAYIIYEIIFDHNLMQQKLNEYELVQDWLTEAKMWVTANSLMSLVLKHYL